MVSEEVATTRPTALDPTVKVDGPGRDLLRAIRMGMAEALRIWTMTLPPVTSGVGTCSMESLPSWKTSALIVGGRGVAEDISARVSLRGF